MITHGELVCDSDARISCVEISSSCFSCRRQTNFSLSTNTCEAGAEIRSRATSGIRAYFSVYYYIKCVLLKAGRATLKTKMCNIKLLLVQAYNVVKTQDRVSLSSDTLKCYLYIRHNMPPLYKYDARAAVLLWLKDQERRLVIPQKSMQQPWFTSMFDVVHVDKDKDYVHNDSIEFCSIACINQTPSAYQLWLLHCLVDNGLHVCCVC